jgi:dipeptidyl aminopeptidase/acylaminoacyl peptidase
MRPADIGALTAAGTPRVSPDGSLVAFVVTRVDMSDNRYRSQIWLAPADGSRPAEPFSAGDHADGRPTWSPDGRRLAFTSQRAKSAGGTTRTTVHSAPVLGGGETATIAASDESVRGLTWAPDGRHLAYVTRVRDARYDIDDPKRQPPRHITRFFSRLDDVGWTHDRPAHVHIVAADGSAEPVDVTPGEHQFGDPAWAPDGQALVFAGATHDTWDLDDAIDLFLWRFGDAPVPLTKQTGVYGHPAWSMDGSSVAFLGFDESRKLPQNSHVGVLDLASGTHRWLGASVDRSFAPHGEAREPVWDGSAVLATVEDRGRTHLYRVPVEGHEPPELVIAGDRCVTGFDVAGGTMAFAATTTARPAEIFVWRDGTEIPLSHVTDSFVARAAPRAAERFTAASTGGAEVDVWVYLPSPDDEVDSASPARHPALVNIHGGPFTQYGDRFFDEAQLQVSAGYAVIMCNPRGSSGREESWGRAINGRADPLGAGGGWGSVDYEDVLAATDAALARYPSIDPGRVGVLGGSYGGYLTTWIVGHTDRFVAACSERAVNNMASEDYTSDISTFLSRQIGTTWFDDPEEYRRLSPITYVRDITTPLLILHSEDDLRCPIEQAEQLFAALRLLGREVEFYRFPAEGHELSRSGSPVHRVQRAELILEFFGRYLQRS